MNWVNLTSALNFYKRVGFEYIDVPWVVPPEVVSITKPPSRKDFNVGIGSLIGSGEQGFLKLCKDQQLKKGRYVTLTPCFRDEPVLDDLHKNYFMKVELIDMELVTKTRLFSMLYYAADFFERLGMLTDIIPTVDGYDIIDEATRIELGSYGIRHHEEIDWIFGTGCAEPRTSYVQGLTC